MASQSIGCHAIPTVTNGKETNININYRAIPSNSSTLIWSSTDDLQIFQISKAGWNMLEFIVTQIQGTQSFCNLKIQEILQKKNAQINHVLLYSPIMKKLPGNVFSFKLLYDKSSTSRTGNAPNPRGNAFRRLIERFKMRNFGIDEIDTGSSSTWLLAKFKISKFVKLAMPGGIAKWKWNFEKLFQSRKDLVRNSDWHSQAIRLWLNVTLVTFSIFTVNKPNNLWCKH